MPSKACSSSVVGVEAFEVGIDSAPDGVIPTGLRGRTAGHPGQRELLGHASQPLAER